MARFTECQISPNLDNTVHQPMEPTISIKGSCRSCRCDRVFASQPDLYDGLFPVFAAVAHVAHLNHVCTALLVMQHMALISVLRRKTDPEFLEHIPSRLRTSIDELPGHYERQAMYSEHYWGRQINLRRRAIWQYDSDDPEGEPDNDAKLFKRAARLDGKDGYAKIDAVWWEAPAWERRKQKVAEATTRGEREDATKEWGLHGRQRGRRRRVRAQSLPPAVWICTLPRHQCGQWGDIYCEEERSKCPMRHDHSLHGPAAVAKGRKRSQSVV